MPVVTRTGQTPRVVVVSLRDSVRVVTENSAAVNVLDQGLALGTVVDLTKTVNVAGIGKQGLKGDTGLAGSGQIPPINFSWGDASPVPIHTLGGDALADLCQVVIEAGFNGVAAKIAIGTQSNPELLMPFGYNAAGQIGSYETSPDVVLLAGTQIILTIVPGAGASMGTGKVLLSFNPL